MKSHVIDYEIIGDDMQVVEIELDPGETVIAEAGMMSWMDDGIDFSAKMGDGSDPDQTMFGKVFGAGKRLLTGESLFMTHFTNIGNGKKKAAFSAPYPGKVIPLSLRNYPGRIICQKDSFLCAALGTQIDIVLNRRFGSGFFGGEGFILQSLEGDGNAFIHAGGTIVEKNLDNETLKVDTGCIVAFTDNIEYDIEMVKGLKSIFFGGEGLFLATLHGTGKVWLQTLPFSRLADRIIQHAPVAGGKRKGEGSVLGMVGDLLDGD